MAIEGPLRELALSDVFQLLELSGKTGVLTVRSEARERPAVVRFERGAIVGAELPHDEGRLGYLLLRSGKLSETDLRRVLRQQREEPGVPFGALAVRMGVVSAADVQRQLAFQVEETVCELMRWNEGYFRFEEAPAQPDAAVPIRIPTRSLLMEAARRLDEWSRLAGRIPHSGVIPVLEGDGESDDGAPLDLEPHEWEVLAEIDGERSLRQIATELGRSDFDVAQTVCGLLSARIVTVVEPRPSTAPSRPATGLAHALAEAERALGEGRAGDARRLVEPLLGAHPEHAELHLLVGRALAMQGRAAEAAERLERAARLDPLSAVAHFYLGCAAARAGDLARAEQAWTTFLRLPEARGAQGERARRALRAVVELRTVVEGEP